jgi:hypothetical protein
MENQKILVVHPKSEEQFSVLKAFLDALKIKFELSTDIDYHPDFVAKIEKARQDYKEGKGQVYTSDQLKQLCK